MLSLKDIVLLAGGFAAGLWYTSKNKAAPTLDIDTFIEEMNSRHNEPFQNYRQLESLMALYQQLNPIAPLPPMRRWAISPDFGVVIMQHVRKRKPELVVEASAGASTIITAYTLRENGSGRVIAIEHDEQFAQAARNRINEHQLQDIATVIHAPLKPLNLNGGRWPWYDPTLLSDISDIDMLTVDGPPQWGNPAPMARYPALPYFYDRLNDNATVLVDDTNRSNENKMVARWLHEFAVLKIAEPETEKGTIILSKGAL
ncbi:MAG: class I SAM-dependent methyltransferase [Anaerolineae bacterium]|nr:class I SAM-dependent methyltransferase [Anaerolineae bacterium]